MELHTGDRLSREEFHRIYEKMPEAFKAELIGGIVYVASPLKRRHGTPHLLLGTIFGTYKASTPGVEGGDNTTLLLGDEGEPQPDLYLRILEACGGQTRVNADDYIVGVPELLAEIAWSSRAIDLHAKKQDYTRYGGVEYVVACLRERQLRWFDLRADTELPIDADGVCRVRTFPGLWIHGDALFADDYGRALATLEQGLAMPQHAEFVKKLAAAGQQKSATRSSSRPAKRKPQ
jgi:Uma2 family endonuclease